MVWRCLVGSIIDLDGLEEKNATGAGEKEEKEVVYYKAPDIPTIDVYANPEPKEHTLLYAHLANDTYMSNSDYQNGAKTEDRKYYTERGVVRLYDICIPDHGFCFKTDEFGDNKNYNMALYQYGSEFILGIAGTADLTDLGTALIQPLGVSKQYSLFNDVVRDIKKVYPNLTIVAHSMGGAIAANAAMANGVKAVTFNADAVALTTKVNSGGTSAKSYLVHNYVMNDFVRGLNFVKALFMINKFEKDGQYHYITAPSSGFHPIENHFMINMINALQKAGYK